MTLHATYAIQDAVLITTASTSPYLAGCTAGKVHLYVQGYYDGEQQDAIPWHGSKVVGRESENLQAMRSCIGMARCKCALQVTQKDVSKLTCRQITQEIALRLKEAGVSDDLTCALQYAV